MPFCYCPGCAHDSRRERCSFYRFPADHKQFNRWKKMCRRADRDPTREDRLCSCHFNDGNKMLGPTIFPWNKEGVWKFPYPEKRIRKTKEVRVEGNVEVPINIPEPMEAGPSTYTSSPLQSSVLEKAELYFLEQENRKLKDSLKKGENRLSFRDISGEDTLVFQYTGLPTSAHFLMLHSLLQRFALKYYSGWNVEIIPPEDQLLCTLMKLRLNLQMFDLAFRFELSSTTMHNIIMTYVYALHEILYQGMMNTVPSRYKNSLFVPTCFRDFPNCKIVLDCTEIEIAVPRALKLKKSTIFA
ncbi:hypothetical protein RI129_003070 [Pyrocoelia pectoralis]|uniref:THAP-type domain-containing protein n=1 Tax=Pyrocoelia pectoralis TaxID=417401 RepID=A0AAN7VQC2_9COLE